jgi:ABC-2 type transport system permease protein
MNIFLHELKAYRKSTIIWTLSIVAFTIMFFSLFPALTSDIADTKQLFEGFPEAIRNGMGLMLDNFGSILGYYSFPMTFVVLIGAIQAMNMGTSVVSKEVRDKTADFLLSKPVTRAKILTSKILAVVTCLVITNVIYIVVATIVANSVSKDDFSFKIFFMISITLLFVQLIFMSLGVLLSVIIPKIKFVLPMSLGTVFTFYFISFLSTTASDDALRYITPFKYFDSNYIVINGAYETKFIIISLVFIAVSIASSYIIYQRKDVHSV